MPIVALSLVFALIPMTAAEAASSWSGGNLERHLAGIDPMSGCFGLSADGTVTGAHRGSRDGRPLATEQRRP